MIEAMHMLPCHSVSEAIEKAEEILNNPKATITAIPDGVSVMVAENHV